MPKKKLRKLIILSAVVALLASNPLAAFGSESQRPAGYPAWAPWTAYAVGALVTYNGVDYRALQAHTSQPGWEPPNVPALWQVVTGGPTNTPTRTNTPSGPTATPTRTPTRTNTPAGPTATPTRTNTPAGSTCWPAWVSTQVYVGGAQVSRFNQNYQAAYWTQGNDPATSSGPAGSGQPWIPMGACGGGGSTPTPTHTATQGSGSGFSSIVSEAQFNQMFPNRNAFYTYAGLVTAAGFYPAFAGTGSTTVRKQEAAAALANFSHETGGLVYINEIAMGEYCDASNTQYPCAPGKRYYGRGPIQLSWNFNYGAAGQALGLPLLANPDLVAQDAAVAWKTALWYWMTQNGPGTMTPHNAMVNSAGFGETIRSINGALECNGGNPAQVQSRVNIYTNFTQILGVPTGSNLYC